MSLEKAFPLKPTAPSLTKRYSKTTRVQPSHTTVPAALFTRSVDPEPQYLPLGWTSRIHPEGQLYFYRDCPLKVVTEAHLYEPKLLERVLHWSDEVLDTINRVGIPISDCIELYIELDDSDESSCLYYLVDHSSRSVFWLEPISTELLELSPVVSTSHLKLALEELYWNHLEYFPSHIAAPVVQIVDDLIDVFTHAQADCMTSEFSTFPYTSEQSERFLKLLRPYQGKQVDRHIICFVARLWGVVANHRFTTHYGQDTCRLSRDQQILLTGELQQNSLLSVLSRLLFGMPANCVDKFDGLWIDEIVYADQWRKFMQSCQAERKLFISWAFGSIMVNLMTTMLSIASRSMACSSILFAYLSIIFGLVLFIKQQHLAEATASEAAVYLQSVKHEKYGFQFVSLLYSLPKAFLIWSVVLYIPQGFIIACQVFGLLATAGMVFGLLTLALVLQLGAHPVRFPSLFSNSRSRKDDLV